MLGVIPTLEPSSHPPPTTPLNCPCLGVSIVLGEGVGGECYAKSETRLRFRGRVYHWNSVSRGSIQNGLTLLILPTSVGGKQGYLDVLGVIGSTTG